MTQASTATIDLIRQLVAIPTISRDSNLEFIDFVSDRLRDIGAESERLTNPDGTKANLYARIGPTDRPAVLLSGHSDVVPVDGQDWSRDPFKPWIENQRLYGRGTCDMKGFIGIVLAHLPALVDAGLETPVHVAISYDEELGCSGVGPMVHFARKLEPRPKLCVIGEPTSMRIVTRHKGICAFRTRIRGKAGHSSAPERGANAVIAAARMIQRIAEAGEAARSNEQDESFDPPYTTVNVGPIRGGSAVNIIADQAEFEWEYRPLPETDTNWIRNEISRFAEEELLVELRRNAPAAAVETELLAEAPPLAAGANEAAERFVRSLTGANASHAVSFTTEAGLFQRDGAIPSVVCGPGDIAQAHAPDEYISFAQIAAGEAFMRRLAGKLCSA